MSYRSDGCVFKSRLSSSAKLVSSLTCKLLWMKPSWPNVVIFYIAYFSLYFTSISSKYTLLPVNCCRSFFQCARRRNGIAVAIWNYILSHLIRFISVCLTLAPCLHPLKVTEEVSSPCRVWFLTLRANMCLQFHPQCCAETHLCVSFTPKAGVLPLNSSIQAFKRKDSGEFSFFIVLTICFYLDSSH